MILPGRSVFLQKIIQGLTSVKNQVQPCGIDLSLKRVFAWTSAGAIDFDNKHRKTASISEIPFEASESTALQPVPRLHLHPGAYLVEFNETIDVPLDVMGTLHVRSSLWRSGALMSAGVMDPGYKGSIGGVLQVLNPHGLTLLKDAKLAQFVFHKLTEKTEGYSGMYQNKNSMKDTETADITVHPVMPHHRATSKPLIVTPENHTMGNSLLRYLSMKIHPLVDSSSWDRIIVTGIHDRSSASVIGREKAGKPFNWMRPTAKRVGHNLHIQCFPGVDHVEHYGALLATYLHLTRKDGEWERVEIHQGDSRETTQALKKQTNLLALPRADIIVTGLVHHLGDLTKDSSFVGGKTDEFAWAMKKFNSKNVAFVGCRFSFWGSISGDIVRILAEHQQPSQIIYFGKLGTTKLEVRPNRWLASGHISEVHGLPVEWENILLPSIRRVDAPVILGKHQTLGSVLWETPAWLESARKQGFDFVDPEVGSMGRAAVEKGVGFGYLHLISDNVAQKYPEDLSNEREPGVLVGREKLYRDATTILGDHLSSL